MKKFRPNQAGTTADTFDIGRKVTLDTSAVSLPWNFKFPATAGTAGFTLATDGAGNLYWAAVGAATDSTTPYFIPIGETFVNNLNRQSLWSTTILVEGTLEVNGILEEVD